MPAPQPPARGRRALWLLLAPVVAAAAILIVFLLSQRAACRPRPAPALAVDTAYTTSACVVRAGEILPILLNRAGLAASDAARVSGAMREAGFNPRAMRPGDSLVVLARDGTPRRLLYRRSYETVYRVDVDSAACRVSMLVRRVHKVPAVISGAITGSLYETMVAMGERPELIANYTDIFGWEIDFFSEVQPGDSFAMLVERKYADSVFVGYGLILAASYSGQVGTFEGCRFTDPEGTTDYYNAEGQNLRKTFLKSPLRFSRVSSFFGRRFHPIRRVVRQHFGVDYVAPRGTPVECVADGRVVSAGWSGGYGRLVQVGHADGFTTRYGHLSGFARGVRAGSAVTQGQVIGYVGSTGLSTGPHLHYEVHKFGSAVNPLRLNPPRRSPVKLAYLPQFRATRDSLKAELAGRREPPQSPPPARR